jgi:hypothetical protein
MAAYPALAYLAGSAKAIEVTGPRHSGIGCCRWEYQVENFFGMVRLVRSIQILLRYL